MSTPGRRPVPPPEPEPEPAETGRLEVSPRLLLALVLVWYGAVAWAHYSAFLTHR